MNRLSGLLKRDADAPTVFLQAVIKGETKTVRSMLRLGQDVNEKNRLGENCLHLAVRYQPQNRQFLQLLVDEGADPQHVSKRHQSPLEVAINVRSDAGVMIFTRDASARLLNKGVKKASELRRSGVKERLKNGITRIKAERAMETMNTGGF